MSFVIQFNGSTQTQTYICPPLTHTFFVCLFVLLLVFFICMFLLSFFICFFDCLLASLFVCCMCWMEHAHNFHDASKRVSISKLGGLVPSWGPFFPSLSFRTMSSRFPRLGFLFLYHAWATPYGCGYVYISTLCVDILRMLYILKIVMYFKRWTYVVRKATPP